MDEFELQGWERELQAWKRRLDGMQAPTAMRDQLNALAGEIANLRAQPGLPRGIARERVQRRLARLRALDEYVRTGALDEHVRISALDGDL